MNCIKILIAVLTIIGSFQISAQENTKSNLNNNLGIKLFNTNEIGKGFGVQYERRLHGTSVVSFVFPIDLALNFNNEGVFGKISGWDINPGIRINLGKPVSNYFYFSSNLLVGSSNNVIQGYDFNQMKEVKINLNRFQFIPNLNIGVKGHFSKRVNFNLELGLGYRIIDKITLDNKPNAIYSELDIPVDAKYSPSLFFGLGYNF